MSQRNDLDRSLARMHLALARQITEAIEDEGVAGAPFLEAACLSASELEGIEEGDTSDLTKLAMVLHALGRRLVINPDLTVQIQQVVETVISPIQFKSHINLGHELVHLPPKSEISYRSNKNRDSETKTGSDSAIRRELIHAG